MSIFERYAPFIQDFIYQNDWESLRAIQVAAGDAIFNTDENVLLSASTASGKTEAAFFPILTQFYEDPPTSVGAIYIGPLKALINDQFLRLNDLCAEAGIPVWHWHGDVSQSHKAKMLKHPSGILQITPESLEAMLLHKHAALTKLFHDLRYIVIDEVHSLMRGDRGGQTICLMERLCRMAGVNPRRIGLSATIGDLEATGAFLAAGTGRGTVIPRIESKGVRWRLSMEHFYVQDQQAAAEHLPEQALPELAPKTDTAPAHADPGIGYIFEHTRGKKCLVFVNSREECEAVTTTLRQYCEARHEPDRFLIHHGNLSSAYRETAETAMKDDDLFLTTVTTAPWNSASTSADWNGHSRWMRPLRSPHSYSAWDAPDGVICRRRCGSSYGKIRRRHGRFCPPPSRGNSYRALPWYRSIWKSAGSNRHGWTGCPTACSTTRPCVPWHPAAK